MNEESILTEEQIKEREEIELAKSNTLNKIKDFLDMLGKEIQNDHEHSIKYKLSELNVICNFNKFRKNYDEHLKVLNKYIQDNRWKQYEDERGDE